MDKKRILSFILLFVIAITSVPLTTTRRIHAASNTIRGKRVVNVVHGGGHSGAITEDKCLYMWGYNFCGQVGDGTYTNQSKPIKILEHVKSIALSDHYSAAINENGDLYVWGGNGNGVVGDGTSSNRNTPYKVLEHVKSVELSGYNVAAITESGDLYMWGGNYCGDIGNGTGWYMLSQYTPVKVLENVRSVVHQNYLTGAITENDELYMWGSNSHGLIGMGSDNNGIQNTPIKILDDVKSLYMCSFVCAAITNNGDLYTWGEKPDESNSFVSNGTNERKNIPNKILENVSNMRLDAYNATVLLNDGSLYMWGHNAQGQVGNGTKTYQCEPTKIMDDVDAISPEDGCDVGGASKNGELYIWGIQWIVNNTLKQLLSPYKVFSDVKKYIFGVGTRNRVLLDNGDFYIWGANVDGIIGNGSEKDGQTMPYKVMENVTDFAVSNYDAISSAITSDGSLYMWGRNNRCQLGDGTTTNRSVPTHIVIPDDSIIDEFTLQESSARNAANSSCSITGSLKLKNGTETSSEILSAEVNAIEWISSNQDIIADDDIACTGTNDVDNLSSALTISFTPKKDGVVTITGVTSNGFQESCEVTVGDIAKFSIKDTVYSIIGEKDISGEITLPPNIVSSPDILQEAIDSIVWSSSNENIINPQDVTCESVLVSNDYKIATLKIHTECLMEGEVILTGTTSDGLSSAECRVIIEPTLSDEFKIFGLLDIATMDIMITVSDDIDPIFFKTFLDELDFEVVVEEGMPMLEVEVGEYNDSTLPVTVRSTDSNIEKESFELTVRSKGGQTVSGSGTVRNNEGFFKIKTHTNSFKHGDISKPHEGDSEKVGKTYVTSLDYFSRLTSGLSWKETAEILDGMYVDEWGGSCFGGSVSMILAYMGRFDITAFGADDGKYYSLKSPKENVNLRDAINMYHFMQYRYDCLGSKRLFHGIENLKPLLTNNNHIVFNSNSFWSCFLATLRNNIDNEIPTLFSMGYSENTEKFGHAIIACGLKEYDNYYKVKMYDLNTFKSEGWKSEAWYSYLYIKKDYSDFIYSYFDEYETAKRYLEQGGICGASGNNWNFLYYYDKDVLSKMGDIAGLGNYSMSLNRFKLMSLSDSQEKDFITVDAYKKFRVENTEGEYLSCDGTEYSGNMNVYDMDIVGEGTELKYRFSIAPTNGMTFVDFENDFSASVALDDTYYAVSASKDTEICITESDGISFAGENFSYNGTISDKQNEKLVRISGTSIDGVRLKNENGIVTVKGDAKLSDTTVELVSAGNPTQKKTISETDGITVNTKINTVITEEEKSPGSPTNGGNPAGGGAGAINNGGSASGGTSGEQNSSISGSGSVSGRGSGGGGGRAVSSNSNGKDTSNANIDDTDAKSQDTANNQPKGTMETSDAICESDNESVFDVEDKDSDLTKAKKKKQTITIKSSTKTFRYDRLKKTKCSFYIKASSKTVLVFKKVSGSSKITVSKKGKVTLKKGMKKGVYKLKIKMSAKSTKKYKGKTKKIVLKIIVK